MGRRSLGVGFAGATRPGRRSMAHSMEWTSKRLPHSARRSGPQMIFFPGSRPEAETKLRHLWNKLPGPSQKLGHFEPRIQSHLFFLERAEPKEGPWFGGLSSALLSKLMTTAWQKPGIPAEDQAAGSFECPRPFVLGSDIPAWKTSGCLKEKGEFQKSQRRHEIARRGVVYRTTPYAERGANDYYCFSLLCQGGCIVVSRKVLFSRRLLQIETCTLNICE